MVIAAELDRSVVVISSADEEEENTGNVAVVAVSSEEEVVVDVIAGNEKSGGGDVDENKNGNKKRRRRRKVVEGKGVGYEPKVMVEPIGISDSVVTEANDASDNLILRKLLRCPRYFDPGSGNLETCYNCGEEGHIAANCTMEKQKKPCFICGMFGHNAKWCSQRCFLCNDRGHFAKDCPNKNNRTSQGPKLCLQCGHSGHDMPYCTNSYAQEDLKEIQCYVCNKSGHLCCVDFEDTGSGEVSCYNCGLSGHTGLGCAKSHGETRGIGSPTLCYVCGEEGHFARGCTKNKKSGRHGSESSTPTLKRKREKKLAGSRSAPLDFGRSSKKKKHLQHDWSVTPRKSRVKYGWVVDDPGDFTYKKSKAKVDWEKGRDDLSHKKSRVSGGGMLDDSCTSAYNRSWDSGWMSPATPFIRSYDPCTFASEGLYPTLQYPHWKHRSFTRIPNSFPGGNGHYHHEGSSSRYGSSSKNRFWRS